MPATPTLDQLRRHAISRTLFTPTTLTRAIERLGFVQMDPLRAPARAQDLILRLRVRDYGVGQLDARYARLPIEEDMFLNYGVLPRAIQRLMHPRTPRTPWSPARRRQAEAVLAFVRERGVVHPREVDAAVDHGSTRNGFGGSGRASTQLLDGMHYRGLLRTARRESGIRLYAVADLPPAATTSDPDAALDALIDVAVAQYAPLPAASLGRLVSMLCQTAAPQWRTRRAAAMARASARLPGALVDGSRWYWPEGEQPASRRLANDGLIDDDLRLLAPFDPLVWDRERFERFWGWAYRFEAYTPAARRVRGYYALPMLWRGQAIGWANLSVEDGCLLLRPGYVSGSPPRERAFSAALAAEHARVEQFLALKPG